MSSVARVGMLGNSTGPIALSLLVALAERQGVGFVDAGTFIACSDLDGIHFEADQHAILGHALAEAVRIMLG